MRLVYKFCCTILIITYLIWVVSTAFSDQRHIHFADDMGVSVAVAQAAIDGEIPLIGQPSHFGGRHLGPAYYWTLTALLFLTQGNIPALVIVLGVLKALCFIFLILLAASIDPQKYRAGSILLTLSILGFASGILVYIQTPWVNHFLVVPMAALVASFWLCLRYGWQWLGAFLFFASICLQTFFGTGPYLLILSMGLVTFWVVARPRYQVQRKSLFLAGLIAAVLIWIPPVLYELQHESNLAKLFLRHGSKAFQAHLSETSTAFLVFLIRHSVGEPGVQLFGSHYFWGIIFFVITSGLMVVTLRQLDMYGRGFLLTLGAGALTTALAISTIDGPSLGFYFNMLIPSVVLASYFCCSGLLKLLKTYRHYWILPGVAAVLVLWIVVANGREIPTHLAWNYEQRSLMHAQELSNLLHQYDQGKARVNVYLRGQHYKRRSALWVFYRPRARFQMAYAPFFKELRSFRDIPGDKELSNRERTKKAELAFYEFCGAKIQNQGLPLPERMAARWLVQSKLTQEPCSTCDSCYLYSLQPVGSSVEPEYP
ncbi:MAG: hypothetical protein KDD62_00135 [Bdellovibrionales bacterium]|nr:hypothetical protein [Bdellovibrionales bacterium]